MCNSVQRLFAAVLLLLCTAVVSDRSNAQTRTIVGGEYFVNVDPGPGNGIAISGGGETAQSEFSLATTSLAAGSHVFYVRYRNSDGTWGPPVGAPFVVSDDDPTDPVRITRAEYFIDVDPGPGHGRAVNLTGGSSVLIDDLQASAAGLAPGLHAVFVRFGTQDGVWGPPIGAPFVIREEGGEDAVVLAAGEYFIGADPGLGLAMAFGASGSSFFGSLSTSVSDLPPGTHAVSVRFKDSRGIWGPAVSAPIVVRSPSDFNIVAAELFFRSPGQAGSGISIEPVGPVADERTFALEAMNVDSLGLGSHRVYARVMREDGTWSRIASTTLEVMEESRITAVADTAYTIIGRSITMRVLENDVYLGDGTLRVRSVTSPANGTAAILSDTAVTYTPTAEFYGWDAFSYEADDDVGPPSVGFAVVGVRNVTQAICDDPSTMPTWNGEFVDLGNGVGYAVVSLPAGFLNVELAPQAENTTLIRPHSADGRELDDLRAGGEALPPRHVSAGVGRSAWTYLGFSPDTSVRIRASATQSGHGRLAATVTDQCDRSVEIETAVTLDADESVTALKTSLWPAYPNPASSHTLIRFDLEHASHVVIKVYDITGREVVTLVDSLLPSGAHERQWSATSNGTAPASGVYFYRMTAGSYHEARSVVMLRTD
jgi:hypothetical protein